MLRKRHKLDVREAEALAVLNQVVRDLIILVPAVRIVFIALPGTHMHFKNAERLVIVKRS